MDIVALYQKDGLGLKRLAKLTGLSPRGVKKRLVALGVYQGASREILKNLFPAALNVNSWKTKGNATVRSDKNGLVLYLPDAFAFAIFPIPIRSQRENALLHLRLAPRGAAFGALRFGLRNENQESAVTAIVQGNIWPAPEWVITLAASGKIELFFQGGAPNISEFFLTEAWITLI